MLRVNQFGAAILPVLPEAQAPMQIQGWATMEHVRKPPNRRKRPSFKRKLLIKWDPVRISKWIHAKSF